MKVDCWRDLERFGIFPLTGEACAYSMRLLCDLSEDGVDSIQKFLGLPPDSRFADPWNSSTGETKHVASIMLHYGMLKPLATFLLRTTNPVAMCIHKTKNTVNALHEGDSYMQEILDTVDLEEWNVHMIRETDHPHEDDRNVHSFSGRTA